MSSFHVQNKVSTASCGIKAFKKKLYFKLRTKVCEDKKMFVAKIHGEQCIYLHFPVIIYLIYYCLVNSGQEATVRTGHGTTDWFQIRKGVCQDCILSPCLSNFYAEYIMQNSRLDEAQAGIKISGKNINNLRYADDTTLTAEREEELKSFLMKVKEESEKVGLKLSQLIQKKLA